MTNKLILSAFLTLGVTAGANAQTYSTNVPATATIVQPISATLVTGLNFGNLAVSATLGGTATVNIIGILAVTGGVTAVTGGAPVTAGSLTINGAANTPYTLGLTSGVTLTDAAGGGTLSLTNITAPSASSLVLDGLGTQNINLGGQLTVGSNQAPGLYTGSFNVSIGYQ
jgi:hypothetical protein